MQHILHGIIARNRRRGRPRRRWTDDIKQWTGIPIADCVQHARDKACGDPWCPCRWPPILRHEEGPRQGKARSTIQAGGRLVTTYTRTSKIQHIVVWRSNDSSNGVRSTGKRQRIMYLPIIISCTDKWREIEILASRYLKCHLEICDSLAKIANRQSITLVCTTQLYLLQKKYILAAAVKHRILKSGMVATST